MSLSSSYEVKAAQKNSRWSRPCLLKGGLRPENPSNCNFFRWGKLLSSLHCSKCLKAKETHICCWKWVFSCAMFKIHSFSRRCDFESGLSVGPRSNFPRPSYNMFWRNHLLLLTGFLQRQFRRLGLKTMEYNIFKARGICLTITSILQKEIFPARNIHGTWSGEKQSRENASVLTEIVQALWI